MPVHVAAVQRLRPAVAVQAEYVLRRRSSGPLLLRCQLPAAGALVDVTALTGQLASVAYLEGRPTLDPTDPAYGLYRRAIEEVAVRAERNARHAERVTRRLLATGRVSRHELIRAARA